jgi:hypothetical protein
LAQYRVTIANASRVGSSSGQGALRVSEEYEFQAGELVESGKYDIVSSSMTVTRAGWLSRGDVEVVLPASVNAGDLFLGQEISSAQGGFASNTVIQSIRNTPSGTVVTLSRPIAQATRAMVLLGAAQPNRIIGNSDGVIVDSNASRFVNTIVASSVFDGIRVFRTDAVSGGVHVFGDSQGTVLGPQGQLFVTSSQNLQIYGNQLSGMRLEKQAFAALGAMVGTNTTPGAADPAGVADYATIDTYLRDRLRIRGNFIGFDSASNLDVGNGLTGAESVVIDLVSGDPGFASRDRINFLLVGDTTSLIDGAQNDDRDDPVSARLLRNRTGLDSQMNQYGAGLVSPPPGPVDRQPTSPRRPIVRG